MNKECSELLESWWLIWVCRKDEGTAKSDGLSSLVPLEMAMHLSESSSFEQKNPNMPMYLMRYVK